MEKYLPILKKSYIFADTADGEILAMLKCLDAKVKHFEKNTYIFRSGDVTSAMGMLLSGSALIIQEDVWGHRNIIERVEPSGVFSESFAASQGTPLVSSVVAQEEGDVMFLELNKVLSVCPSACAHHSHVIQNLVALMAKKTLMFNDKITHISKRSTRDKLLSYLSSESIRNGSTSFDIPYDRQQLADYLCVERAAMSTELSKLQKDGLIQYNRNHFTLSVDLSEV